MGYLNNKEITVDAILTKKGRELLAKGEDHFQVTQFALSDDEVDYSLWDPTHPLGTAYYGAVIENTPVLEAFPDETLMMKYKLVTLPKTTSKMPLILLSPSGTQKIKYGGPPLTITPQTKNLVNGNANLGYTCVLHNSDAAHLGIASGGSVDASFQAAAPVFIGDGEAQTSVTVVGKKFLFTAKSQPKKDLNTTVTIIGNETGGITTFELVVEKDEAQTGPVT
tara:strand:- start:1425 stop:2093 length:669 start_codon:yes stop_codon:yes gene_type:complete